MEKKSFLKGLIINNFTVTIICLGLVFAVLAIGYTMRINSALSFQKVPVAKVAIEPNTEITEDMIEEISVPSEMITSNVLVDSQSITGKYTSLNSTIPEGSFFYQTAITELKDMPDYAWKNIPNEWTVVSMAVASDVAIGNSITPGGYIDIYYQGNDEEGKVIYTRFIQNIKILAVKDSFGNNIYEKTSEVGEAAYLLFAVPEYIHLLLSRCSYQSGTLIPIQRSGAEGTDNDKLIINSDIEQMINLNSLILPDDATSVE